jgi:TonB-linked SusC/RagA family outer membrane protein
MLCLGVFGLCSAVAQRTITGTITNAAGEPLIGANVIVKGTSIGTVADFNGNFQLEVPADANVIVVSYTGFDSKELTLGPSNVVNVELAEGVFIEEVVVTALGIDRNARDVAYANQKVDADELLSAPNKNALEALRGKISGVNISTGSGSVAASTRIVLRGEGSLTGNNNALIVVDGVPIDNSATRSGDPNNRNFNLAQSGYADFGNRFNDLNPGDIESITVLKGPSATSLYGSRGASGVLLITTKKGASGTGKIDVGINSSFSAEQAYVLMQRQDKYGQGFYLPFATAPGRDSGENWSWGPAFDGVVRPWTSPVDADGDGDLEWLSRPYSAVPNQIQNFFDIGKTWSNSIFFSGSKNDFTFYASYANVDQDGILQNTGYNRNSFKFGSSAKLTDKLSAEFSLNYSLVDQTTTQEGYRPFEGQNAYANALQAPVNIPYSELRDYKNPFHSFTGYYGSYSVNPYFILNEFVNDGKINNLLGNLSLKYNLSDRWYITTQFGINNVQSQFTEVIPQFQYNDHFIWGDGLGWTPRGGRAFNDGFYSEAELDNTNYNAKALTNYTLDLSSRIKTDISVGYDFFQRNTRRIDGQTVGGLVVPGFYSLSNSAQNPLADNFATKYRIVGLFGNVRFGLDNMLFLEYSARNDWSSTLPEENNSFFYQAVGASAVLTDIMKAESNTLNYLKLRAGYGTTGKDAGLYLLNSVYVANPTLQSLANNHDLFFPLNGQAGYTQGNRIGNPDLKPELTTTFEIGLDASLFNDRVAFEYTFYSSKHSNQIIDVTLPESSGYSNTVRNLGEMKNVGHEIGLTLRPVVSTSRGFSWEVGLLYADNENEVTSINPGEAGNPDDDITELTIDQWSNVISVAAVGLPFGTFKGQTYRTNAAGQIIVGANGLPLYSDDLAYFGSYQPDWTGSISNTFGWKGFTLNALLDIRVGGQFLSLTKDNTEFNGTALTTLIGPEERGLYVVPNSVIENPDGTFSENTIGVAPYDYIRNVPFSDHLIDADYLKLREISLKYQVPRSLTNRTPFESATVGIFAKNVKFWLADENTFADPEVNGPGLTGNAVGVETSQVPPSRSYGITLNLIF